MAFYSSGSQLYWRAAIFPQQGEDYELQWLVRSSTSPVGFMATTNSPRTTNSPGIPWPSLARLLEISMWRETTKLYDKMSINIMNIYILTFLYILNDSWFRQFPHLDWPVVIVDKKFRFLSGQMYLPIFIVCMCSFVPKINF